MVVILSSLRPSQGDRVIVEFEVVRRAKRGFDRGQAMVVIERAPHTCRRVRGPRPDGHRGRAVLDVLVHCKIISHIVNPFFRTGPLAGQIGEGSIAASGDKPSRSRAVVAPIKRSTGAISLVYESRR